MKPGTSVFSALVRALGILCLLAGLAILPGAAAAITPNSDAGVFIHPFEGDPQAARHIFVLFDGTRNTKDSATNVWRLFEILGANDEPQTTAIYLNGVGSLDAAPLTGAVLGRGMEARILKGYEFIAQHYAANDNLYIFDFSRGAHQARSLAGLIAYAGVPKISATQDDPADISNLIIERHKKRIEKDHLDFWKSWSPGRPPPLASELRDRYGLEMLPARVRFLGVWDTVPGSSLKKFADCSEKVGFVKRHLSWLIPGIDRGQRYKSGSYPPIRRIAHAVSIDEKRSKFSPLLLCDAINPEYTDTVEVWFPGAHADVGGGYADSSALPSLSLDWMLGLLGEAYPLERFPQTTGDALGLAHWSMADSPANKGSKCVDRELPEDNESIHPAYYARKNAASAPVRWRKEVRLLPYPIGCSDAEKL